jgi:hypothetical protein
LTPGDYNPCTYTPSEVEDGVFTVTKLGIGGPQRDAYDVIMEYDPGAPEQNDHSICPIIGETESGFYALWSVEFLSLHQAEVSKDSFLVTNWDIVPYGEFPAKKLYERPGSFGGEPASESTHILLKHTPDAPNP